jgi:hypothetical protein
MKRGALAIAFHLGPVFSHPNVWFMRAAETVSPSLGGEGRGEGGLSSQNSFNYAKPPALWGIFVASRPQPKQAP